MKRRRGYIALALAGILTFGSISACGNSDIPTYDNNDQNLTLEISASKSELAVGESLTIELKTNGDKTKVTFVSSDSSVASVSNDGVVLALKEGTTTISAKLDDKESNKLTITVKSKGTVSEAPEYLKGGFNFVPFNPVVDANFSFNDFVQIIEDNLAEDVKNAEYAKDFFDENGKVKSKFKNDKTAQMLINLFIENGLQKETFEKVVREGSRNEKILAFFEELFKNSHSMNAERFSRLVYSMAMGVYETFNKDEFIEIVSATYSSLYSFSMEMSLGNTRYNIFGANYGSLRVTNFDNIIKNAPNEDIKNFYQNLKDNSVKLDGSSFTKGFSKLSTYIAQILYSLIETEISKEDGQDTVYDFVYIITSFKQGSYNDSELMTRSIVKLGNYLADSFLSFDAFKEFYLFYLDFVEENYDFILNYNAFFAEPGMTLFIDSDYKEVINEAKKYYKEVYAAIRYFATLAKSLTEEEYKNFLDLFKNQSGGDNSVETFVAFSKKLVSTFTLFGNNASDIKEDVTNFMDFFVNNDKVIYCLTLSSYHNYYSEMLPEFGLPAKDIVAELEYASKLDANNISLEEADHIQKFLQELAPEEPNQVIQYFISGNKDFKFNLNDNYNNFYLEINDGNSMERVAFDKLNIEGFDTSTYGTRIATFTYNNLDFAFKYYVCDKEHDYYYLYVNGGNLIKGNVYEEVTIKDYDYNEATITTKDLINFSTEESGEFIAYYKVNNNYHAFSYRVFEKDGPVYEEIYFEGLTYQGMSYEEFLESTVRITSYQNYTCPGYSNDITSREYLDRVNYLIESTNLTKEEFEEMASIEGEHTLTLNLVDDNHNKVSKEVTLNFEKPTITEEFSIERATDYNYFPSAVLPEYLIGNSVYKVQRIETSKGYREKVISTYSILEVLNGDEIDRFSSERQELKLKVQNIENNSSEEISLFVYYTSDFYLNYATPSELFVENSRKDFKTGNVVHLNSVELYFSVTYHSGYVSHWSDLTLNIYDWPVVIESVYEGDTYIRVGYVLKLEDFGTDTYHEVEIPLDCLNA